MASKLFKEFAGGTIKKWQELSGLTMQECLEKQANDDHDRLWRVEEIAGLSNIVNEREEIFISYIKQEDGKKKRRPRVFKPTRLFMQRMVDASMTNGAGSVWDLDYTSPRFGECGWVVRLNQKVPYGLIKHMTVVPAGFARRCFVLIFNLGIKLDSIEVAAEELCKVESIDPYLTILLAMYHLKRGDHGYPGDIENELLTTLRLLETAVSERGDERFQDVLDGLKLMIPRRT